MSKAENIIDIKGEELLNYNIDVIKILTKFIVITLLIFFSFYYTPALIKKVLFLLICLYIYFDDDVAVAIVINYFLASNFAGLLQMEYIPHFTIVPGSSFMPSDIMLGFLLLRVFNNRHRYESIKYYFKKPVLLILSLAVFFFIGTILTGAYWDRSFVNFRMHFYYISYIIFVPLLVDKKQIKTLIILIFVIAIFSLFTQFIEVILGKYFGTVFFGSSMFPEERYEVMWEYGGIRAAGNLDILFVAISCIVSLSLLKSDKLKILNRRLLVIIFSLGMISILLTSTRQWLIFAILLISGFLYQKGKRSITISVLIIGITVFIILNYFFSEFSSTFLTMKVRFGGLLSVAGGEIESISTAISRINQFKYTFAHVIKSPIIGYGYSRMADHLFNSNVSTLNSFVYFGVFGFFAVVYLVSTVIKKINFIIRNISDINPYLPMLIFLKVGFIIFVFLNFTVQDMFILFSSRIMGSILFLILIEWFLKEAWRYEEKNLVEK